MKITVHGATGAQGGPVAAALRAAGHDVVGITRSTDPAPGLVTADLNDQATLEAAYSEVDSVFVHLPIPSSPDDPSRWVPSVLGALETSNIQRVVLSTSGTSLGEAGDHPTLQGMFAGAQAFHAGLQGAVDSVVALAPRLFLENLLLPFVAGAVAAEGLLAYPLAADKPVSWISHEDVAAAAVQAFDPETEAGIYDIGHDAVTGIGLAEAIGRGIGKEVRYEPLTPAEFVARATPLFGPEMAAGVGGLYEAYAVDPTREIPGGSPQLGA
ncbi:MAG: NmrA family NAD(P)-binding protein, partial [bacterium]|nr:NmrA family NAD(P)-binding protein [bacterium]